MAASSVAESLSNAAKLAKCQVMKAAAVEREDFEFCILLRDKQREYRNKVVARHDLVHFRARAVDSTQELEIHRFLKKIPQASADYFYTQLRDQFTRAGHPEPDADLALQQRSLDQAIMKLTPAHLLSQLESTESQGSHGGQQGLITEKNYFYALNHAKVLHKELCFIQWVEGQAALAEDYGRYTAKQIAAILSKAEKKFALFRQKVADFLHMAEEVQRQVIGQPKFIDFVNFHLSAYWLFAYFTFLLLKKKAPDSPDPQAQASLQSHRRLLSVLQANVVLVANEADCLAQTDCSSRLAKAGLQLGKRYDLVDGAILSPAVQKKIIAVLIS